MESGSPPVVVAPPGGRVKRKCNSPVLQHHATGRIRSAKGIARRVCVPVKDCLFARSMTDGVERPVAISVLAETAGREESVEAEVR